MSFEIHSDYGEIKLGSLRVHWYNTTRQWEALPEEPGFFILGWGDYNLEFGQIDHDRPGIYLTRYVNNDVEQLRTFVTL